MGKTFILKRKTYGYFGDGDGLMGLGNKKSSFERNMVDGDIWNGPKSKLAGNGMAKGLAKGILSPVSVATMVGEQAKGAVENQLNQIKDTAQTYTPTVQNNYLQPKTYSEPIQKSYGVIQAIKEVGTGVGKGIWNYAKQNKKAALGMAGFGAGLAGLGYATNRIQRQKAENEEGTRTTDGMSTGGKIVAGATAIGSAGYAAHSAGKSWNNQMTAAQDVANKRTTMTGGNVKYDPKKHSEFFKGMRTEVRDADNKIVKGADGKSVMRTQTSIEKAQNKINKLNNKSFLGLKGKTATMAKKGALVGGLMATAGIAANSMLKQPKKHENAYSELEQREYAGFFAMGKRVGTSVYNNAMKSAGPNAGVWDKTKAMAKGIGAGINVGSRKLGRSASNFMSLGSNGARDLTNNMRKGLESTGSYGKKAADFIGRHKTGTMIAGAATVGTAGFNIANTAGEKPVNALASLDKKTTQFKNQQQLNQNFQ